jgi:hypothetical protein
MDALGIKLSRKRCQNNLCRAPFIPPSGEEPNPGDNRDWHNKLFYFCGGKEFIDGHLPADKTLLKRVLH